MSKKRFGVSLPTDLAEDLDNIATFLNTDRSSIVAEALRTFIHDHLYALHEHKCLGLLIAVRRGVVKRMDYAFENFREVVKNYLHLHTGNICIEIYIVSGSSSKIRDLQSSLKKQASIVRYIPLATVLREELVER